MKLLCKMLFRYNHTSPYTYTHTNTHRHIHPNTPSNFRKFIYLIFLTTANQEKIWEWGPWLQPLLESCHSLFKPHKRNVMLIQSAVLSDAASSMSFLIRNSIHHPGSMLWFYICTSQFLTVCLSIGNIDTTKILVLRILMPFQVFVNVNQDVLSNKEKWLKL